MLAEHLRPVRQQHAGHLTGGGENVLHELAGRNRQRRHIEHRRGLRGRGRGGGGFGPWGMPARGMGVTRHQATRKKHARKKAARGTSMNVHADTRLSSVSPGIGPGVLSQSQSIPAHRQGMCVRISAGNGAYL
ncbi:hypothetical protein JCM25156A_13680 [Komagataeibacter kakiaceti JCM 25156]